MYQEDLAYIQHHGFSDFARSAGPGLVALLRRAGVRRGHVVDLGCGDGTWLRMLTWHGYTATGIESSRHLVRYAEHTAPRASVKHGSVYRVALPRCDAITAIGEVLSYRSPRSARPHREIFRRAYRALRPGGLFAFDLLVAGPPMSYVAWRGGSTWTVLVRVTERKRVLTRQIITFRKFGRRYRRGAERHQLSVVPASVVMADLRRIGFHVTTAHAYGDCELPVRRLAFIARKADVGGGGPA